METQNTYSLVEKIKTHAVCIFAETMFGKPEHINFDHDIIYYIPPPNICSSNPWPEDGRKYYVPGEIRDLLHIGYPTSQISDVYANKQQYSFTLIAARVIDEQDDVDIVEKKFSDLETKMWLLFERLSDCDVIILPGVQVTREKGTFNDKLVTVTYNIDLDVFSACLSPQC
mgnify:CR=1 FL=1